MRPAKRLHSGMRVILGDGTALSVLDALDEGIRMLRFPEEIDVLRLLDEIGDVPLPPYITDSSAPREAYQTIFARETGSCAAPRRVSIFPKRSSNRFDRRVFRFRG